MGVPRRHAELDAEDIRHLGYRRAGRHEEHDDNTEYWPHSTSHTVLPCLLKLSCEHSLISALGPDSPPIRCILGVQEATGYPAPRLVSINHERPARARSRPAAQTRSGTPPAATRAPEGNSLITVRLPVYLTRLLTPLVNPDRL